MELRDLRSAPATIHAEVLGVRISLLAFLHAPLETPIPTVGGVPVASVRDIAAMKIEAIASRGAREDFHDVYFICLDGLTLDGALPGGVGDPCLITIDGPAESLGTVIPTASVVYACNTADGVACDIDSARCVALSQTTGPCTSDNECVAADYCDSGDSTNRPPECFPRVGIGEACSSPASAGKDPECQTGAFCDPVSSRCKSDAQARWICADGSACLSGSCVGGACRGGLAPRVCSSNG